MYNEMVMKTISEFLYFLLNKTSRREKALTHDEIKVGVRKTVGDYESTIRYLDKYDKGKVPQPKSVARHSTLRNYLQSL